MRTRPSAAISLIAALSLAHASIAAGAPASDASDPRTWESFYESAARHAEQGDKAAALADYHAADRRYSGPPEAAELSQIVYRIVQYEQDLYALDHDRDRLSRARDRLARYARDLPPAIAKRRQKGVRGHEQAIDRALEQAQHTCQPAASPPGPPVLAPTSPNSPTSDGSAAATPSPPEPELRPPAPASDVSRAPSLPACPEGPRAAEVVEVKPAGPTPTEREAFARRERRLAAGVGVSAGLTLVTAAAALGTRLYVLSGGPLNQQILATAKARHEAKELRHDRETDICLVVSERGGTAYDPELGHLCDRRTRLLGVSTALWVTTGALVTATAVLSTLLVQHRRSSPPPRLSVGLTPTGINLALTRRF